MTELFDSLPAAAVQHTFVQYLIACCSRSEAATDVISDMFVGLSVPDRHVKFRDSRLHRSLEILPNAFSCGIFDRFSNFDKCRLEVAGDINSGRIVRLWSAGLVLRIFVQYLFAF